MSVDHQQSFNNSLAIRQLQTKRKILEMQTEQRRQDVERNNQLTEQKLEKELEILIADKHLINKRNAGILQELNAVKSRTINNLAKVRTSNEHLVNSKQEIYNHLQQYHPKLAKEFFSVTNVKPVDYLEQLHLLEARGAQMKEKEINLSKLQQENQNLKDELQFQRQQKAFVQQYQNSPYINLVGFKNQTMDQKEQRRSDHDKSDLYEGDIMDKYLGGSQSDINQADFSIEKQQKSEPNQQQKPDLKVPKVGRSYDFLQQAQQPGNVDDFDF